MSTVRRIITCPRSKLLFLSPFPRQLEETVLRGSSSAAQVAQRVRAWLAQLSDLASSQQPSPPCGSVSRKTFSTLCAAITSVSWGNLVDTGFGGG